MPQPPLDEHSTNPLDESEAFQNLCEACRRGDLPSVQQHILQGANVNAVDRYDYLPLTLASLCGHYDVVLLLLESGAVCERDTFQGERILYNALNGRIRELLLRYDYAKSADQAKPWAAHIASLAGNGGDVFVAVGAGAGVVEFRLHGFLLRARSPYFRRELVGGVRSLRVPVDRAGFEAAVKVLYLRDDVREVDRHCARQTSRCLEIPELADHLPRNRQARRENVRSAQESLGTFFRECVLSRKLVVPGGTDLDSVKVYPTNDTFADVLLCATDTCAHVYAVHKPLLRSEFFVAMFASPFREGLPTPPSAPLPIITLDVGPPALEILLAFFYSDDTRVPLEHALDALFAADQFLVDRLKVKCAQVIATAGHTDHLPSHVYDVVRAGWATRVSRLEEFGAKYIADRLERYISDPEFAELVAESADRIQKRQETDTIELVDDIRYYLDERFRMRVEDNLGFRDDGEEVETQEEVEVDRNLGTEKSYLYHELLEKIDEMLEGLRLDA